MPEVVVRIQNVSMFIEGDLDPKVHDEIRRVMSYVVPGHEYMPQYKRSQIMAKYSKKDPWDGTKTVALHGYGWRGLKAPSGLYSYLKEVLARNEVYHRVVDERPLALPSPGYAAPTLVPRDYQQEQMIAPALDRQRGVMKASTGSGKTEVLVKIIVEAGVFPAFFYVTSCDLLRQAYNRFSKYVTKDGQPARIGRVGDGYCDIQPITISTVQSAQKALTGAFTKYSHDDYSTDDDTKFSEVQKRDIQDAVREAQFVYVDEAHHCSAQTIQDILNNSHKARWRIGGSASPWRDDGLDILIEACFGKRFCDITASYLIERGFLVKPIITFNHFRQALGNTTTWAEHYKKYIVENTARNKFVADRAAYHLSQDRPTIILIKHVPHAEALQALIPGSEILTSSGACKKTSTRREELLDKMRARELMCIIATSLLDEGVDVPAASVGIFAGGGKSSSRELQRIGRFIRVDKTDPEKKCAWIEEFDDHSKWLNHHARERRKILATEPLFEVQENRDTMSL